MKPACFISIGVFLSILWGAKCANILFIASMPAQSHFSLVFRLAKELADRGHQVTVISPYPRKESIKNYRDISVEELVTFADELKKNLFAQTQESSLSAMKFLIEMTTRVTEITLENEKVQQLLHSGEKFDAVFADHCLNEALLGFGYSFKAPVIVLAPSGVNLLTNSFTGNPAPASYVRNPMSSFPQNMNFWERLLNFLFNSIVVLLTELTTASRQRELFKKYISSDVTLDEVLRNNISLVLANSHISISDPLPKVPAVIEIGGYHVNPPKKLPDDLQNFLDNSKEGVILFSMGSNLRSQDLNPQTRAALLNAFSKIKQKVLWKFETDLPEAPENVKIQSWLPQQDVLAHPNVKAFISHGGLLSTIEAIYHGVPVLGIPVYGDQINNIARGVNYGYAIQVPLKDITEESISNALDEILNNPKYRTIVKHRSRLMHDQPVKPIDLAIYWIEHVIRYKGAPHLRSAALDLAWYQVELFDVVGFLIFTIILLTTVLYMLVKKVCRFACLTKTKASKGKKNK